MEKWMSRILAFLMAIVLIVNMGVTQVFAAEEAQLPPNEIQECTSNFGIDFKLTFSDDAKAWLSAVAGITVGGTAYTKADSSYGVWSNTNFYVDANNNYLLIGEAFEEETAECVVQADGYANLILELNKSNHTAVIKDVQGGGTEHIHAGGIATCQQKAVCPECGQEYGELGDHTYENGKCTVCGLEETNNIQSLPTEIQQCSSNFGTDFKLTFSDDAKAWLGAVTSVTVAGNTYTKTDSSYGVWRNTSFYIDADNNYLLIGEAFEEEIAECVVQADGYADLILELNKSNYTAVIKENVEHTHTGGTATCQQKAICEVCGQEYGELGDHTYENGKCTVCGLEKIDAPSVTVNNSDSTYFVLTVDNSEYMQGISSILCNGNELEETEYKIALNGTKYYLDKANNAIYFDKMSGIPFQSGDIITIQNAEYKDLRLKISIGTGEVTVKPVDEDEEQGDEYKLYVRLVGYFEAALVNQKGYDAMSAASTNITQNKNSNVSVEAALLLDGAEPTDSDWKLLNESGVKIDPKNTRVNIDDGMGMVGVYSIYDSSITLAGTPTKAGEYKIGVTVTDDQGRTATSNDLIFKVYSGQENLEDQLILENCTQTADQKYMYDMEPWAIRNFDNTDNTVTVPKDIKAWYGSHTSGTYGELGYAVSEGDDTTQTLIIPEGCNLTFVNMDILSSVRIVVENGATLILRDSTVQGIIDVKSGGKFSMNYNEYEGKGEFLTGASINGQLILRDGAILENAKIYSNTNFIANGKEVRKNSNPVVVTEGNVTVNGQVFIRGDEAATGTDPSTGKSFAGQTGLLVKDGTLNITEGSVLAVYGGGYTATTSVGGAAIIFDNGSIAGEGKLIAVGGQGMFDNGGNATEGKGTIAVANAYLEGGNSYQPKTGCTAGKAVADDVSLSGNTNRNLIDGKVVSSEGDAANKGTYWSSISEIPDLSLYTVENNAPGEHKHTWQTEWSKDEKNHWYACSDCDEKKDLAAHIPGPEATETTPQTCTVCGYVMQPAKELKNINDSNITISDIATQIYTGKEIQPSVKITDDGKTLKLGTDYKVTYKNNKDVGRASVIIEGIGNYTSKKTKTFAIIPQKVTNLKATAPDSKSVKLSWSKLSNVTGYRIYRSTDGENFSYIKTLKGSNKLTYVDENLTFEKRYYYEVRGYVDDETLNKRFYGVLSDVTSVAVLRVSQKVTNLKATVSSYNSIKLSWDKLSDVTGYRIYRSTDGKNFTYMKTLKGTKIVTYVDENLTTGTTYYYKVRAYLDDTTIDKRYYGALSASVKAKPTK